MGRRSTGVRCLFGFFGFFLAEQGTREEEEEVCVIVGREVIRWRAHSRPDQ